MALLYIYLYRALLKCKYRAVLECIYRALSADVGHFCNEYIRLFRVCIGYFWIVYTGFF